MQLVPDVEKQTLEKLKRRGTLVRLARAFTSEEAVSELLDRIDFPHERRPIWQVAQSSLDFWSRACREIERGLTSGGLERLLAEAEQARPGFLKPSASMPENLVRAPDLSWLWEAFSVPQPVQLIFGTLSPIAAEPQIEHYLVTLLEKYTRLLAPIIHRDERLYWCGARIVD